MQEEWSDEIALAGYRAGLEALRADGLPEADALLGYFREHEEELFSLLDDDEIDIAAVMRGSFTHHGAELTDDDLHLFLRASHEVFASYYQLASTTHALLEALRRRELRLALVSNTASPEWLLRPVLEDQGLVERMDAFVLSSEVGKRKPHRAMFERALSELGVAPDEALFVGDRREDRKSTRLNSSHANISYAVFCLKKKTHEKLPIGRRTSSRSNTVPHMAAC